MYGIKYINIIIFLNMVSVESFINSYMKAKQYNRNSQIIYSESTFVPDSEKRTLMNSILLSSLVGSCGPLLASYIYFFYPAGLNNKEGGLIAKDKNGDDIETEIWLKGHKYPSRALVQGLKGDAYYLITTKNTNGNDMIEKYALNAVCTHLGCVVPWNVAENKFMCPCHGSQYDSTGKVIRGPAPKSLALANLEEKNGKVILSQWTETDFRTNEKPWWN